MIELRIVKQYNSEKPHVPWYTIQHKVKKLFRYKWVQYQWNLDGEDYERVCTNAAYIIEEHKKFDEYRAKHKRFKPEVVWTNESRNIRAHT